MSKRKKYLAFSLIGVVLIAGGVLGLGYKFTEGCSQPDWWTKVQKYLGGRRQLQIAFTGNREGGFGDIYLINVDGTDLKNLTNHPGHDDGPVWSPDGQKIAFVSSRDGNVEIYAMDADGRNVQRLTYTGREDFAPHWSPDGCKILHTSTRRWEPGYFEADVVIMDTDGNNRINLTNNTEKDDGFPVWAAGGRQVAYETSFLGERAQLFFMDLEGNVLRSFDQDVEWLSSSPDGAHLLYAGEDWHLTMLDVYEGQFEELTNKSISSPIWAPDGSKVAYQLGYKLFEIDLATGKERLLTDISIVDDFQYSPTMEYMGLIVRDDDETNLYLLDLDTLEMTQVTDDDLKKKEFVWRP